MDLMEWENLLVSEVVSFNESAPSPSPSHQIDHCKRVWRRCRLLGERLGADFEILLAAAFLHDLGRQLGLELHGEKSAELAIPILEEIGFPKEKREAVLLAIASHDYQTAAADRSTLESQILYDSDKMDAFGAIGIVRHINFFYARGVSIKTMMGRLEKRFEGMMLEESKQMAEEDYTYIVEFFIKLKGDLS